MCELRLEGCLVGGGGLTVVAVLVVCVVVVVVSDVTVRPPDASELDTEAALARYTPGGFGAGST